jgi:NADH-quinone oxidoreductase subunit F
VAKLLLALEQGKGTKDDLELLHMHTKWLGPGHTYCALAPGAMDPLASALKYFAADFDAHVTTRGCPWERTYAAAMS